ncbi:MAG: Swt1 family HEPN domain-containing protein, partial [Candidatus Tectimicrobiota bacterium]
MALTNYERVTKALDLLKNGLAPYVERELKSLFKGQALVEAQRLMSSERLDANRPFAAWDAAVLLRLMWDAWHDVFRKTLGPAERSLVQELRDVRNRWAHQEPFSGDDADRALDSTQTPPQHPLRPCIIKLIPSPRAWPPLQQCSLFSSNFLDNTGGP